MRGWLIALLLVLLCALRPAAAHGSSKSVAPEPAAPLTLEEVLVATGSTHPRLDAAQQGVEKAKGNRMAARGAWDPVLSLRGRWAPVGYYEKREVDALVRQATPLWGVGLYAGYRGGWGQFPTYQGYSETLSGGEVRAGIQVPLWRDGPIDKRRANVQHTKARASGAECERDAVSLQLSRDAAKAYWRWVATGQEVRIQEALLGVALERDDGLREKASLGGVPEIVVVDNQRLVLDRQAKLVAAEQDFQRAVLALSLFLRDAQRNPRRPSERNVPPVIPEVRLDLTDLDADIERALRQRPESCKLEMDRRAAEVEVRFRRNQRAPSLNGQAFVARDLGDGPPELSPTEFGVGLSFEMPLVLREARGKYRAAKADARRVDARQRALRDRVGVEVRRARVDLEAAARQVAVTTQQVDVARQLAEAEREKFREGASDLVIVNLREIAAAEAARLEVEARAAHQSARAEYVTAMGRRL